MIEKSTPRPGDVAINLDANASSELRRVTVSPSAGLPADSAIIPNIEAWLKGRSATGQRELLKNPFDDSAFRV